MADFEWLEPWYPSGEPGLVTQLRAEMGPGHLLEPEADIRAIARRDDSDDVLFELSGGRVAEVHLTWRRTRETDGRWPSASIHPSLAAWADASMRPLAAEISGTADHELRRDA